MTDDDRILTFDDLKNKKQWPFSRRHTYDLVKSGKFPRPFKSAEKSGINLWLESEVDAYLAKRANTRAAG